MKNENKGRGDIPSCLRRFETNARDRNNGDDDTIETDSRTEDLYDKHLKEERRVLCIAHSSAGP